MVTRNPLTKIEGHLSSINSFLSHSNMALVGMPGGLSARVYVGHDLGTYVHTSTYIESSSLGRVARFFLFPSRLNKDLASMQTEFSCVIIII